MTPLEVDPLASLAWREAGKVHVRLRLPGLVAASRPVVLRFRDGDRRVRKAAAVTTDASGVVLQVEVPRGRLGGGVWRLGVRVGEGARFAPVDARLLVRTGQPVALLPGPAPRTRMSPPDPRPPAATALPPTVARGVDAVRSRLARAARRVRR